MIKGRPSDGSVTGDNLQVVTPRFVRVKKRAIVTEKASEKEGGSDEKVEDRRASVVFVRKSASLMLKEAGGSQVKVLSPTSRSTPGACTTPGGKRRLAATQEEEREAVERKVTKSTKLEEDVPVRHSSKKKKRRRRGQKVVAAPAKMDHLEEALSYLKTWHTQRESWSFRKKMQVCLLEHMYNSDKISKSLFATLLKYLEGLEGKSRAAEVQRAKTIVEGYDRKHLHGGQEVESGDIGARTAVHTRRQYKRAVEVLRVLA